MATVAYAVRPPSPAIRSRSRSADGNTNGLKRKRPSSRSPSPDRRRSARRTDDFDNDRESMRKQKPTSAKEKKPMTEEEQAADAKKAFLTLKSGGAYIPPAKLRAMQAQISNDKQSEEFQRLAHDARKKSAQSLVNKLSVNNIKAICEDSFSEDLIKARGLLVQSLLRAQAASISFTPVYAAYVAVINSKLPMIGELLQKRLVNRWAKAFRRNERAILISTSTFACHLANQHVLSYILVCSMLQLLLEKPTDDSVEVAVSMMKEFGQHLEENNLPIANLLFDRLRQLLQEGSLEKRTLYAIEVLMQIRRDKYKNHEQIQEDLDIVPDEGKVTIEAIPPDQWLKADPENTLNIYRYDEHFEESEKQWQTLRDQIFGEDSDDDAKSGSDASESESEDEAEEEQRAQDVKDMTAEELVQLRRRLYLTMASSSSYEECCHKLMKIQLPAGKEFEAAQMIVETASQRPTYEPYYGRVAQRLCEISRNMRELFEQAFSTYLDSIHRYEQNRLRIIAQVFSYLLGTESIGWYVFQCVTLTEEETTASSRIFIMILFQGMVEEMGIKKMLEKFREPSLQPYLRGIFPTDNQKNTRFAINYFTSISMGPLTEDMRKALENMPKAPAQPLPQVRGRSPSASGSERSFSSSYYSYSGSSRSRSRSYSDSRSRSRSRSRSYDSRSPPRRGRGRSPGRGRSYTRSVSDSRSRSPSYSRSRSPPRRRRSPSRSRSPPRRRNRDLDSRSRSPPRRRQRSFSSRSRSPPRRRPSSPGRRDSLPQRTRSPPRFADRRRQRSPSTRSRSPQPRRRPADSRSRSPPPRRRPHSRSRSPPPRRRPDSRSPSPPRRRRYSSSRSRTPPRRK